jgi:hypothetical protein
MEPNSSTLETILTAMAAGPISATQLASWVEAKPSRVRRVIAGLRASKAIEVVEDDGDLRFDFQGAMFIVTRLNTPIANRLSEMMAETVLALRDGKLRNLRGPKVDVSSLNQSLNDLLPEIFPLKHR